MFIINPLPLTNPQRGTAKHWGSNHHQFLPPSPSETRETHLDQTFRGLHSTEAYMVLQISSKESFSLKSSAPRVRRRLSQTQKAGKGAQFHHQLGGVPPPTPP